MNIFVYALKESVRLRVNILLLLVLPFSLLFIPRMDDALPFGLSLYGMLMFYTAFLLSKPVAEDRMKGIIVRVAASPTGVARYLGGHLGAYFLLLGLQIALFLVGSLLVHRLAGLDYLHLALLYLSFSVMCTAFALAWNNLFRTFTISFGLFAAFASIMCLVSGVSLPLLFIPQSIRNFTMFLPTYWLPHGIMAIQEGRYGDLLLPHAILAAYAAVFFLLGTRRKL